MMKYWFAWAVIALFVASTPAAEKETTKPKNDRLVVMDTDKDGKVSMPEFIAAGQAKAIKLEQVFDVEQAKARFVKKDKNADGFLTQAELESKGSKKTQPKIDDDDSDSDEESNDDDNE
jgi:Ca2+-binding EF-hand superfamily protein